MRYVSEEELRKWILKEGCDEGCGYVDERDMEQMQWEEEPFINLPCISTGVCREHKDKVLDKIRAEIEKVVWDDVVVSLDGTDEIMIPRLDPDDVFEIIDKYRESGDKE